MCYKKKKANAGLLGGKGIHDTGNRLVERADEKFRSNGGCLILDRKNWSQNNRVSI
jgi:hypothetical protein